MNMQQMMRQAQKMQKELAKAQEEVATMTAEGTAGGGMVSAVVGQGQRNRAQLVHTKHALHFVRLGRCRVRGKRVRALVQRERQLSAALVGRHQRPRRRLGK